MFYVNYSKGQFKIQQMAFMLIAVIIFFTLVALIYFVLQLRQVKNDSNDVASAQTLALVRTIKSSPEFAWTADSCHACIDLDKVMGLKDQKVYSSFWNTPFLKIRVLDGKTGDVECTKNTYPGCNTISLVNVSQSYRSQRAYAALCRLTSQGTVCSLGTISIGAKIT
jgi:hypothetical protein